MTKTYERLLEMFIYTAEEYRIAEDRHKNAKDEPTVAHTRAAMLEAAARVATLYDVAQHVFQKQQKNFIKDVERFTNGKFIYMEITPDKYELPVAVADTATELAQMVGVDPATVRSAIFRTDHSQGRKARYIRVREGNAD